MVGPGGGKAAETGERITAPQAARQIDGNEYLREGSDELFGRMARSGLVAVFGGSDNLVYFAGAVAEELPARNGLDFRFTSQGLIGKDAAGAPPTDADGTAAAVGFIRTVWWRDRISWSYDTDIPHETFVVLEDGEPYCIGMVFALAEVGAPRPGAAGPPS